MVAYIKGIVIGPNDSPTLASTVLLAEQTITNIWLTFFFGAKASPECN
jgi:hypothetical protein